MTNNDAKQTEAEVKLERLVDSFNEWKSIYGFVIPTGYVEQKDRANERKKMEREITKLRNLIRSR